MIVGKPLTTSWQEAIGMLTECKIVKTELVPPGDLHLLMQDPAGQRFLLRVLGVASIGLSGNIVVLNAALNINCHEVTP